METEILAKVEATLLRRVIALASLVIVSGLLFSVALDQDSSPVLKLGGALFGLLSLWTGVHLFRATQYRVELREDGLWDSSGIRIVSLKDVAGIERGMLAFKPSNGFLMRTRVQSERAWRRGFGGDLGSESG